MPFFKNKYRTESNRLKNWDYSSKAIYFITLVTQNRECIFGDIENKKMVLNNKGKIIETEILKSIQIRDRWFFHNWVIMPNHIHLLIEIVETPVETHGVETHGVETHGVETHGVETHGVETHCRASLHINTQDAEIHDVETHGSASLRLFSQSRNQFPKSNYSTKTILPVDTDLELRKLFISRDAYLSYIESINGKSSIASIVNPSPVEDTHPVEMQVVETHCGASLQPRSLQQESDLQPTKPNNNLLSRKPKSISSFVAVFKSVTTRQINPLLGGNESDSIWQSNYHDHIVMNCDSFDKIYYYIKNNPKNWNTDSINS